MRGSKTRRDKVWYAIFKNYEGKLEEFLIRHNLNAMKSVHPYASFYLYDARTAKRLAYEQCTLLGVVEFELKKAEIEYIPYKHDEVRVLSITK